MGSTKQSVLLIAPWRSLRGRHAPCEAVGQGGGLAETLPARQLDIGKEFAGSDDATVGKLVIAGGDEGCQLFLAHMADQQPPRRRPRDRHLDADIGGWIG
jgi:hypothetical protein